MDAPNCLVVRVERPGRILAYMSGAHVATLSDGDIKGWGRKFVHTLFWLARTSAKEMSAKFKRPTFRAKENLPEAVFYEEFSLWNTYAGIANLISVDGHGGTLIIVPSDTKFPLETLRIKYQVKSFRLQSAFIAHLNARHQFINLQNTASSKPPRTISGIRLDG